MKKQEEITELLKWRYAHRGLHQKPTVPENSMDAFRRAVMAGFGIELDVHLTRDGRLAVIHDSSLKRTCGVDINIEDMELHEAQVYFLEKSQETIPDLEEVLSLVEGRVPLIVELKAGKTQEGSDTTEALCRTAMSMLDDYKKEYGEREGRVAALYCVESFSPVAVKWLRSNRPDVIRGQLAANLNREKKILPWMQNFLLKNLLVNRSGKPDFVAYCYEDREEPALKRYQGPLFFWTIREYADLADAEKMGAAAIFEKFNPKDYESETTSSHSGAGDLPEIRKVDKDTELADKLIRFVENFSWEDVKEHTLRVLRNWEFSDWETMLVALEDEQIVGMASVMKTDYYPLPEIFPWISTIFVDERYRGHRISGRLIEAANEYARSLGFDKTYIPSEHIGLYEKYGYRYLKDIVNYGDETDHLYVKKLK